MRPSEPTSTVAFCRLPPISLLLYLNSLMGALAGSCASTSAWHTHLACRFCCRALCSCGHGPDHLLLLDGTCRWVLGANAGLLLAQHGRCAEFIVPRAQELQQGFLPAGTAVNPLSFNKCAWFNFSGL